MYAHAYAIQQLRGRKETIVIDDVENQCHKYLNSLMNYPLENVKYVHNRDFFESKKFWLQRRIMAKHMAKIRTMTYREKYEFEKKRQRAYNRLGLVLCENGFVECSSKMPKNIFLDGYFQCEKYFELYKEDIKKIFSLKDEVDSSGYPNLELIRARNTICISIKVQHNVGDEMYDVCSERFWNHAIQYMVEHVENPLFFICSDNVEYVKKNLIDFNKYDTIVQDSSYPVHISLAVMAQCRHFIIGNTSFGWWAQYLCVNPDKIVVAPSRWYGVDVPCDIYQRNWHMIEV